MYKNGEWDFSVPHEGTVIEDLWNAVMLSQIESDGSAEIMHIGDTIRVTTKFSKNNDSSRTGGDYNYYRRFALRDGVFAAWSDWSCDFAGYSDYADPETREYTKNLPADLDEHKHRLVVTEALRKGDLEEVVAWVLEDTLEFYERVVRYHLNS